MAAMENPAAMDTTTWLCAYRRSAQRGACRGSLAPGADVRAQLVQHGTGVLRFNGDDQHCASTAGQRKRVARKQHMHRISAARQAPSANLATSALSVVVRAPNWRTSRKLASDLPSRSRDFRRFP
jgi:hypothetical protein